MRKKWRLEGERCRKRRIIREVIVLGPTCLVFDSQSLARLELGFLALDSMEILHPPRKWPHFTTISRL